MKTDEKGFTLIEIIISLVLITIIGTGSVIGIKTVSQKITIRKLEDIESKIFEAVNIYIETNTDSKEQFYTENNGVMIPLNVLEDEGLITFDTLDDKEIEENYVISVLGSEKEDDACVENTQIGSWNLDKSKVIYLCATQTIVENVTNNITNNTEIVENIINNTTFQTTVKEILEGDYVTTKVFEQSVKTINARLDELEKSIKSNDVTNIINKYSNNGYYIAEGLNPNNFVSFEVNIAVNNDEEDNAVDNNLVYIDQKGIKDHENLWRIISIDGEGNIKLIYDNELKSNNSLLYNQDSTVQYYLSCNSRGYYINNTTFYKMNNPYNFTYRTEYYTSESFSNSYVLYLDNSQWNISDIYDSNVISDYDNSNKLTKLGKFYDMIEHKDMIIKNNFFNRYKMTNGIYELDKAYKKETKIGTISKSDIDESELFGVSWLSNYNTLVGVYSESESNFDQVRVTGGIYGKTDITNPVDYKKKGWSCSKTYRADDAHDLYTYSYYPVIVLNSSVKLNENPAYNNAEGTECILGSPECPYVLEYTN